MQGKYTAITLIAQTYTHDSIGQPVAAEKRQQIPAEIHSASRAEFSQAGQMGISAAYTAIVLSGNYNGEQVCILDGVRYAIYRTYEREDEQVELYLQREVGA